MLQYKAIFNFLGYPNSKISSKDFYINYLSSEYIYYKAYIQLQIVVRQYIQLKAQLEFKELKAPLKYNNYKWLSQYKQALWNIGININALNTVGIYIVKKDRLPFTKDQLEEDIDLKDINIKTNFKFPN